MVQNLICGIFIGHYQSVLYYYDDTCVNKPNYYILFSAIKSWNQLLIIMGPLRRILVMQCVPIASPVFAAVFTWKIIFLFFLL